MNIIVSWEEIPEDLRPHARKIAPGQFEIESSRLMSAFFWGSAAAPVEADDPHFVVLKREDARNVQTYHAALAKVGGDRSRIRIR